MRMVVRGREVIKNRDGLYGIKDGLWFVGCPDYFSVFTTIAVGTLHAKLYVFDRPPQLFRGSELNLTDFLERFSYKNVNFGKKSKNSISIKFSFPLAPTQPPASCTYVEGTDIPRQAAPAKSKV